MRTATLYSGHVLDILPRLPAGSIQCCCTSPPYFGLRDYKLPPQIWDGEPGCAHEWGPESLRGGPAGAQGATTQRAGRANAAEQARSHDSLGTFCRFCGAWRGSLGLEPMVGLYVQHVVQVFAAVWRVLRDDGTLWLNLGDSYASTGGHSDKACNERRGAYRIGTRPEHEDRRFRQGGEFKPKDLIGAPWRVALALQDAGWYLRSEIIWSKPAPMPESVRDRPTRAHEHIFLLSKSPTYFYDSDAVREPDKGTDHPRTILAGQPSLDPSGGTMAPHRGIRTVNGRDGTGRNMRTVWEIGPEPCPDAHFATFPSEIPQRAILAGTSAAGCCGRCGAPWVRVTARRFELTQKQRRGDNGAKPMDESNGWQGFPRGRTTSTTTGWHPTCDCFPWPRECPGPAHTVEEAKARIAGLRGAPVPCTVLDPFLGSGRTGITALGLGRSFTGIDLSETYLERIARPAIEAALQAHVGEKEPPVLSVVEQGSLW